MTETERMVIPAFPSEAEEAGAIGLEQAGEDFLSNLLP